MSKKTRPRKKRTKLDAAMPVLKGFQFLWDVYDPLAEDHEVFNDRCSHSNPLIRTMAKQAVKSVQAIVAKQKLKFRIEYEMEFSSGGKSYFRSTTVTISGLLSDANDDCERAIEDLFSESNTNQYVITHVKAEILGMGSIKNSDFS